MAVLYTGLLVFVCVVPMTELLSTQDFKGSLEAYEEPTEHPTYSINILTADDIPREPKYGRRHGRTYKDKHRHRHQAKHNSSHSSISLYASGRNISFPKKNRRLERNPSYHGHRRHFSQELSHLLKPSFDSSSPKQVTAQLNSHAFLPCIIHNVGDKTVSWIRNRDAHILTVNMYTFIAGSQFISWYDSETSTWTLQIKFVQQKDMGSYECQVSTEPKMSHFVDLKVIAPEVTIPEGRELHIKSGSDITLKCAVSQALQPPPYVFWYHEPSGEPFEKGEKIRQAPLQEISRGESMALLTISNARDIHEGNYTCAPAGISRHASVFVHVLSGEHPAGLQHGSGAAVSPFFGKYYLFYTISMMNVYITIRTT